MKLFNKQAIRMKIFKNDILDVKMLMTFYQINYAHDEGNTQ